MTRNGRTVVSAVDPMQTVAARENPVMQALAEQVQEKLKRAIGAL